MAVVAQRPGLCKIPISPRTTARGGYDVEVMVNLASGFRRFLYPLELLLGRGYEREVTSSLRVSQ
jgi:hypothetical protein